METLQAKQDSKAQRLFALNEHLQSFNFGGTHLRQKESKHPQMRACCVLLLNNSKLNCNA